MNYPNFMSWEFCNVTNICNWSYFLKRNISGTLARFFVWILQFYQEYLICCTVQIGYHAENFIPPPFLKKEIQDRSHQWSTWPAHIDLMALFWSFGWCVRSFVHTYVRVRTDNLCENSDHYGPGLWSASWIKNLMRFAESLFFLSQPSDHKEEETAIQLAQQLCQHAVLYCILECRSTVRLKEDIFVKKCLLFC